VQPRPVIAVDAGNGGADEGQVRGQIRPAPVDLKQRQGLAGGPRNEDPAAGRIQPPGDMFGHGFDGQANHVMLGSDDACNRTRRQVFNS